jgi:hypothetical protein
METKAPMSFVRATAVESSGKVRPSQPLHDLEGLEKPLSEARGPGDAYFAASHGEMPPIAQCRTRR